MDFSSNRSNSVKAATNSNNVPKIQINRSQILGDHSTAAQPNLTSDIQTLTRHSDKDNFMMMDLFCNSSTSVNAATNNKKGAPIQRKRAQTLSDLDQIEPKKLSIPRKYQQHRVSLKRICPQKTNIILATIVILFLVSHFGRVLLKIYEVSLPQVNKQDNFILCSNLGR